MCAVGLAWAAITACSTSTGSTTDEMSLREQEKAYPSKFITITGAYDADAVGQSEIRGALTNKAHDATYGNIVLRLDFYDENKNFVSTQTVTIDKELTPGETENFEVKFTSPETSKTANWTVVGATVQ